MNAQPVLWRWRLSTPQRPRRVFRIVHLLGRYRACKTPVRPAPIGPLRPGPERGRIMASRARLPSHDGDTGNATAHPEAPAPRSGDPSLSRDAVPLSEPLGRILPDGGKGDAARPMAVTGIPRIGRCTRGVKKRRGGRRLVRNPASVRHRGALSPSPNHPSSTLADICSRSVERCRRGGGTAAGVPPPTGWR